MSLQLSLYTSWLAAPPTLQGQALVTFVRPGAGMLAVCSRQALWCVVWQGGGIQNTLVLLSGLEAVVRPTGVSHGSVRARHPALTKLWSRWI